MLKRENAGDVDFSEDVTSLKQMKKANNVLSSYPQYEFLAISISILVVFFPISFAVFCSFLTQ